MFDAGWLAEVRELLRSGVSARRRSRSRSSAIAKFSPVDSAELKLEETILEIQKSTRHFAKRQLTWFRKEPNVHWLDSFGDNPAAESQALALL